MIDNKIKRVKIVDSLTVAASTTEWSNDPKNGGTLASHGFIEVGHRMQGGFIALEYTLSGTGTATFEYVVCNGAVYPETGGRHWFYEPASATDIATGITVASGSDDYRLKLKAYTSGGTATPVVGDQVVGATSGATGYIHTITLSSGTYAGGDAAGNLTIRNASSTAFQSENLNVTGRQDNIMTIAGDFANNQAGDTITFEPELSKMLALRITETGGANAVVVNAWYVYQ